MLVETEINLYNGLFNQSPCAPKIECCCTIIQAVNPNTHVYRFIDFSPFILSEEKPTGSIGEYTVLSVSQLEAVNNASSAQINLLSPAWAGSFPSSGLMIGTAPIHTITDFEIINQKQNDKSFRGIRIKIETPAITPIGAQTRFNFKATLKIDCSGKTIDIAGCAILSVVKC
jgi:hypothetical protein